MKINIGPYRSDLIPVYGWGKQYEFWRRPETYYLPEEDYTIVDKFVFGFLEKLDDLVRPINRWSNRRKRKINIHIDGYDVWSADQTLAMIITPTLKKLKEVKHGYPSVDDEDVPAGFDSEARWEWVLNEMIWAFEQHAMDDDSDQFHHNADQLQMVFTPVEGKKTSSVSFNHQKDPTKPAYWIDQEGKKKHHERKQNGLRLFAKYYECLWD